MVRDGGLRAGGLRNITRFGNIPDAITNQWKFDEGSGTTLNDAEGSVSATLQGGTWQSDSGSVGGYRIDFEGSGDYWLTDSAVGLDGPEMTMMTWVTMDSFDSSNDRVLTYGDFNDDNVIQVVTTGNGFDVYYYSGGSYNDTSLEVSNLNTGTRYLIAFVGKSNDDAELYVYDNSSLIGSATDTFSRSFLPDDKLAGMARRQGDITADGKADAPAISNDTALTQSEIEEYRDATVP